MAEDDTSRERSEDQHDAQGDEQQGRDDGPGAQVAGDEGETEKERLDRNLEELLQELRVALPGVQVLFAFLLTVPFTQAFPGLSEFERHTYFVVLCLTAISTALLIAPSAFHRVLFRMGKRRQIVDMSNRLTLLGLAALACAMSSAILLIAHVTFGPEAAIASSVIAIALFATLWYVVPRIVGAKAPTVRDRSKHDHG